MIKTNFRFTVVWTLYPEEFELKYYIEKKGKMLYRSLQIETLKSVHKMGFSKFSFRAAV